jgi:hypothetical protein
LRGQTKTEGLNDLRGRPTGGGRRFRLGSLRRRFVREGCAEREEQAAERGERFFPHRRSPEAASRTTTLRPGAPWKAPGAMPEEKIGISPAGTSGTDDESVKFCFFGCSRASSLNYLEDLR